MAYIYRNFNQNHYVVKQIPIMLICCLFFGCQQYELPTPADPAEIKTYNVTTNKVAVDENDAGEGYAEPKRIVLGQQLPNPYTVKNMQAAFDYYNAHVENSQFENKNVGATHQYIKILPSTNAHLQLLDSLDGPHPDSLVIHDYPLDYEILKEGDYYVQPESEIDLYHPAYTVVPADYVLPGELPYEVLAAVYKPTKEEFNVETIALVFADFQEDIMADYGQEITVEELPVFLDTLSLDQNRGWWRRYRPYGWVHIENTKTNTLHKPLARVRIRTGRFIWWRDTNTNNDGFFRAAKRYRGEVRIRAKWRSAEATVRKTFLELLGFWVSDHLMTITRNSNGKSRHIKEGHEHLWFKGTVHNGIIKYNNFAIARGISHRVWNANVWAWENGNGNASTPMLYRYRQLSTLAAIAGNTQFTIWNHISHAAIGLLPSHLHPDMFFTGLKNKTGTDGMVNTARIQQTVFHESAHFSHALKAGSWFWANVFAAELANQIDYSDPYHDGIKPTLSAARRIALAEGWGNLAEFKISLFYYGEVYMNSTNGTGMYNANSINTYMESFDVYDTPMNSQRLDDRSWFLHGIMWDLLDNQLETGERRNGNGVYINDIHDIVNISTYSNNSDLYPIFQFLNSDVNDAADLKQKIINQYQNPYTTNGLFNSYGY